MTKPHKKSLKNRLYGTALLLAFFILLIFSLILIPSQNRRLLNERKEKLRAVVDIATSLALKYEKDYRRDPTANLYELQNKYLRIIKDLRYDKNEFFFIIDGSGRMILHPLQPELYRWNMLYETDVHGRAVFDEVVLGAMREGEVFVEALWQSKYSEEIFEEQIIHGVYFWQWDWIICSTLFTQDIKDTFRNTALITALYVLLTFILVFYVLFLTFRTHIANPLNSLLMGINEFKKNNLDYRITALSHDELGYISDQFNSMVDERRRFEEQLVLSQKQELVGTLVSGVSHDFNNIIGGIAAVASHLNMSLDEPKSMPKEEQKDFLEIIEQNCDRASSLVGQLLSFGKKKKLNLANVAIADIFRGVEVLSRLSLDRSVKFIIDYPDMHCMIQADQTQLEQALLNICINAGHAMTIMRKEGEAWGGELHLRSLLLYERKG